MRCGWGWCDDGPVRMLHLSDRLFAESEDDFAAPAATRRAAIDTATSLKVAPLPNIIRLTDVQAELDECGFQGQYDFLYLPGDFATGERYGWALVNFLDAEGAVRLREAWHGATLFGESVVLTIEAAAVQGLAANLQQFNTDSMRKKRHPSS